MRIGVLGGGQLGRMLALAGIPYGHEFVFLEPGGEAVRGLGELIAASILAGSDRALAERLHAFRKAQTHAVLDAPDPSAP